MVKKLPHKRKEVMKLNIKIYQANEPTFRVEDGKINYNLDTYHKVYEREEDENCRSRIAILEDLFCEMNSGPHPEGYTGYSLSVSDIVLINDEAYICANCGWDRINIVEGQ